MIPAFKLNPLEVFELPSDATSAQIKRAYKKLSMMVHPDKCGDDFRDKVAYLAMLSVGGCACARARVCLYDSLWWFSRLPVFCARVTAAPLGCCVISCRRLRRRSRSSMKPRTNY